MVTRKKKPLFSKEQEEYLCAFFEALKDKSVEKEVDNFFTELGKIIKVDPVELKKAPEKISKWLKKLGVDNTLK